MMRRMGALAYNLSDGEGNIDELHIANASFYCIVIIK